MATSQQVNVADVIAANQAASAAISSNATSYADFTSQIVEVQKQRATAAVDLSTAEQTLEEQKQLNTQAAEATRARIATQFGLNADAQGYVAADYAAGIKDRVATMLDASASIQQKQSINFLDNPLGYIAAQLTVNSDIDRYNAALREKNTLATSLQELETLGTQQANNQVSQLATVNKATLAAGKIQAGYRGMAEAHKAIIDGARYNLEGITAANTMTLQKARLLGDSFDAINKQKSLEISQAHLAVAQANFELSREAKQARLDEESVLKDLVARGYQARTGNPIPDELLSSALAKVRGGDPRYTEWRESGIASLARDPTGNSFTLANSPYAAATALQLKTVGKLSDAMQVTATALEGYKTDYDKLTNRQVDRKDKTAVERDFNEWLKGKITDEQNNIRSGSMYAPAGLSIAAQGNRTITQTPLWQNVLGPLAASGAKLDEPSFVVGQITNAIREGKLSFVDAVDIAPIYKIALEQSNQTKNFSYFGLPNALLYNATSPLGTGNHADSKWIARQLSMLSANTFKSVRGNNSDIAGARLAGD